MRMRVRAYAHGLMHTHTHPRALMQVQEAMTLIENLLSSVRAKCASFIPSLDSVMQHGTKTGVLLLPSAHFCMPPPRLDRTRLSSLMISQADAHGCARLSYACLGSHQKHGYDATVCRITVVKALDICYLHVSSMHVYRYIET